MIGIPLGPFLLHTRIGYGGAGDVWRATHGPQGVAVAVKVLTASHAREPGPQEAFRHEVRAVAGLHHPAIVLVFDHGEVTAEAERQSAGELVAGSPYLAMELATGGTLKDRRQTPVGWDELQGVVLSVLDALAHAHARGVVHRDVKPANVLLSGPSDLRPGPKLTDFGIAHAQGASPGKASGTPAYMAPELMRASWREVGPWTDLYALGCVAWELATGGPPFGFGDPRALARAHVYDELPAFAPRSPVPEGFESWLRILLEKDPRGRYERCADAAWALSRLGPAPEEDRRVDVARESFSTPTLTLDATLLADDDRAEDEDTTETTQVSGGPRVGRPEPAPVAATWRREAPPPAPLQLVGAGLGLWGLRTAPLVDRDAERDAIWSALLDVRRERRPRALLIQGAAGNGKSRLVQWMGERAHELGAATVLEATHSPMGGPTEGLGPMVLRRYHGMGLDRAQLARRLVTAVIAEGGDEAEADALTELVAPGGGRVTLEKPEERFSLVARVIARAAARRPVVVWLDDAQWGAEALRFVRWLLGTAEPLPVLLLLTVQEEAVPDRPVEAGLLEQLVTAPGVERVPIRPLGSVDQIELVRGLLALEPALAAQVADRTAGNPLFAVQLLGDWVQRGILEPSDLGFRLKGGASADLPDDLHAVWAARVGRVVSARERDGLEIAACLGREVDEAEWRAACEAAGAAFPDRLVDRLVAWRLAHAAPGGFAFVHGMLREAVLRLSADGGRAARWHRACAAMLATRQEAGGVAERRGRHLWLAGAWDEAAETLFQGAKARERASEDAQALALLDLHDEALDRVGAAALDRRRGRSMLLRAKCLQQSRRAEAERLAREVEARGRQGVWAELLGGAIDLRAELATSAGTLPEAERLMSEARALHQADGKAREAAFALRELAHIAILAGDLASAEERSLTARAEFTALGDREGLAMCWNALGDIARLRRDWETTARCFREAMAIHASLGRRAKVSLCRHGLAEVDRLQGRLAEAERGYREVIAMDESLGRASEIPQLNLGLCLLAAQRWSEARQRFDAVRRVWAAQGRRGYVACVSADLLPALYALRDFGRFDGMVAETARLLAETGMVDLDIAWPAELAGDLAARANDVDRAREAYAIALSQWRALGDGERVAVVEAAVSRLD